MKPISSGLSHNSPQTDVCRKINRTHSFKSYARFQLSNVSHDQDSSIDCNSSLNEQTTAATPQRLRNKERRGRYNTDNSQRIAQIHEKLQHEIQRELELAKTFDDLKKKNSDKDTLNEIHMIIKESEDLRHSVFDSVPRDPQPSFRVVQRHQKYVRIWNPHKEFYDKNSS